MKHQAPQGESHCGRSHLVAAQLLIVASLLLIVTPGQDMILVMSHSIAHGSAAGVATAAGVSVGLVGHTILATLGLGVHFAFLPQFVHPDAMHPTASIFVLGLVFTGLTFLVKGPVGLAAGGLSGWLRSHPTNLAWLNRKAVRYLSAWA